MQGPPPLGNFERYKCEGEREVYKMMGFEIAYKENAKVTVTMEKKGEGCYVETWKKEGYTIVTTSNGDVITTKFPDGKQVTVKQSEFVDGWAEFEMDGIKRRHKREYLSDDEYIMRSEFSKDGKTITETEHYRRTNNKMTSNYPPLGSFERYKSEGEIDVYKLMGIEQYYKEDAKVTVTMETRGDGCYVETWSKDGYNIVTIGNKDDITVKYPGGKEIKLKQSEFVDGWCEFDMDGMKRRHKKEYLSDDEYIMRGEFTKEGKTVKTTDYYRRVANKLLDQNPKTEVFERYNCENELEVLKLMGFEQYYKEDAKVTVTMEKKGDGCYVETWSKEGYNIGYTSNGDDVTIKYPEGKEIKLKRSEFVDGWCEFEMDGMKRRHKREYLSNDEYIARGEFLKDGKTVKTTEYYKRTHNKVSSKTTQLGNFERYKSENELEVFKRMGFFICFKQCICYLLITIIILLLRF